jgi:hypothetical protein
MIKRAIALTAILSVLLNACAFSGGQIGAPSPPRSETDAATLIIYRDRSWVGLFGTIQVAIDRQDLLRLGLGQSYSLRLDPGTHSIEYSIGLNDCGGILNLAPRQTLRVRLSPLCAIEPG